MPEIILPSSVFRREEKPAFKCRIPTGPDSVCGHPFTASERPQFIRHVKACAKRNEEHIRAVSPKTRLAPLSEGGDSELVEWVAEHRDEILEGRKWIGGNRSRHRPTDDVT